MNSCNINRTIAQKVGFNKLDKTTAEVDFNLMRDIDSCVKLVAKNYVAYEGETAPVYSRLLVPQDMINVCESWGCKNSGTLLIPTKNTQAAEDYTHVSSVTYTKAVNSVLFSAGVMYFYAHFPKAGEYDVAVTIGDIKDSTLTNGDKYTQKVTAVAEGFMPITIDLAVAPSETVGSGWTATTSGIRVKIELSAPKDKSETGAMLGVSSIAFFDDIDELATNEVVKLGCLTGVEGDDTIDALEEQCLGAKYDTTTSSIERTITASNWTPNVLALNPFMHRTQKTEGFYIATTEVVAQEEGEYAVVHLADSYNEECGFIYASISNTCNVADALLTRINNPNLMNLDERQFQVINSKLKPGADIEGSKLYFHKDMVGKVITVSYPRSCEVEEFVANERGINEKRVKMSYTKVQSDGVVEVHVFENVLVTSFPQSISNSDSEFSFSISVQRNVNGDFYRVMKHNRTGEYL